MEPLGNHQYSVALCAGDIRSRFSLRLEIVVSFTHCTPTRMAKTAQSRCGQRDIIGRSGCGALPSHQACLNGITMNLIRWIKSLVTHRGKALSLYRAGIASANKRDYHGAIANYSEAIRAPDTPIDVKAMAPTIDLSPMPQFMKTTKRLRTLGDARNAWIAGQHQSKGSPTARTDEKAT